LNTRFSYQPGADEPMAEFEPAHSTYALMEAKMTKAARGIVRDSSEPEDRTIATSGEMFTDGSLIELVASAYDGKPALLFWNGKRVRIAPQIDHLGHFYQPLELDRSLWQAMRFPSAARPYASIKALFKGIANLFERYIALSAPEAAMVTAWTATTWFPDYLSSPPTLVVSGPDMSHAITFFRLLGCVCRRGLLLAEFSRSSFRSLPMALRPTLLVSQPHLARTMTSLLRASNYRGLFVSGNGGTVLDIACSKAVYWGMEGGADLLDDTALHLALPPARRDLPQLGVREQDQIANRFQPQMLMYRCRTFPQVREPHPSSGSPTFPNSEMARNLAACIPGEADFAQTLIPFLQRQEQDALARRGCDVNSAVVEVIWAQSHEAKEIAVSQITELTNALLRCRGEILVYGGQEIGWKLKSLGFYRYRNGGGMVLRFSRETRLLAHRLARHYGLTLSAIDGCTDCAPPQVPATQ
jgi:hypothetical protein